MKKYLKWIALSLLVAFIPMGVFAEDATVENETAQYYTNLATHITDHEVEDGVFEIYTGDEMHETFSKENMSFEKEVPFGVRMTTLLKHNDADAVMNVVYNYNLSYLSSLFSGLYQIHPKNDFVTDAIYQEANARNLYEMFNKPHAGEGMSDYDFFLRIEQVKIKEDSAKVIVERSAETTYPNASVSDVNYNGTEAYLLKKIDGDWKIENIIFQTEFPNDTFKTFENTNNRDEWIESYCFENCQRKNYEAPENFTDYLEGSVDEPKMNMESLQYMAYMQ